MHPGLHQQLRPLLMYVNSCLPLYVVYSDARLLQNPEKLQARAARFGTGVPAVNGKKRPAGEAVDAEELERRKKRAERFGLPVRYNWFCAINIMLMLLLESQGLIVLLCPYDTNFCLAKRCYT